MGQTGLFLHGHDQCSNLQDGSHPVVGHSTVAAKCLCVQRPFQGLAGVIKWITSRSREHWANNYSVSLAKKSLLIVRNMFSQVWFTGRLLCLQNEMPGHKVPTTQQFFFHSNLQFGFISISKDLIKMWKEKFTLSGCFPSTISGILPNYLIIYGLTLRIESPRGVLVTGPKSWNPNKVRGCL